LKGKEKVEPEKMTDLKQKKAESSSNNQGIGKIDEKNKSHANLELLARSVPHHSKLTTHIDGKILNKESRKNLAIHDSTHPKRSNHDQRQRL
jgi:hypothetical protein